MQAGCRLLQRLQEAAQGVVAALLLSNVGNPAKSNVWQGQGPPAKLDGGLIPPIGADSVARPWLTGERWTLIGLLIFTLLVRGSVLWAMRGNLQQDPDAYREIAENLLRYGEFALGKPSGTGAGEVVTPTAYRPPLYPVVLSNLPAADGQHVSLFKVAALHLLLGVATVWLTWL